MRNGSREVRKGRASKYDMGERAQNRDRCEVVRRRGEAIKKRGGETSSRRSLFFRSGRLRSASESEPGPSRRRRRRASGPCPWPVKSQQRRERISSSLFIALIRDEAEHAQTEAATHASQVDVEAAVLFPAERDKLVLHVLFRRVEVARRTRKVGKVLDQRRLAAADLAVRVACGWFSSPSSASDQAHIGGLGSEVRTQQRCQSC